jgi:hypothetical protein
MYLIVILLIARESVQHRDLNSLGSVLCQKTLVPAYSLPHSLLESSNKEVYSIELILVSNQFDVLYSSKEVTLLVDHLQQYL